MSAAESTKSLAGKPWPNGDPATWVYLADLPSTPEVEQMVEQDCRLYGITNGFWRWWYRRLVRSFRESNKCIHYFENQWIVYENTPRGKLVLIAGDRDGPEVPAFRENVQPKLTGDTVSWYVYTGPYHDWWHIWGDQDEA